MKFFRTLILLSLPIFITSEPCSEFIERMYQRKINNDYQSLTTQEFYFTQHSATTSWMPAFGNKVLCDEVPEMRYFLAIKSSRPTPDDRWSVDAYGTCLPLYCSSVSALSTNETFIKTLLLAREWPLIPETNYAKRYQIQDPEHWDKPPLYYPVIVLLSLFTLVTVASSIYLFRKRQKEGQSAVSEALSGNPFIKAVIEAFDVRKNAIQLYQTAKEQGGNEDLATFQFWRTISAYWVVHFHTALFNKLFCFQWWSDPNYLAVNNTPLFWLESPDAVENFFFMGGFFAIFAMTPKLESVPFGIKAFLEQLKHRILRIWPVYMILLLAYSQVAPYLWSGPGMYLSQNDVIPCHSGLGILAKIFFLDGLLDRFITPTTAGRCWGSSWYIATEFHVYWFAILVAGVYAKYKRSGRALIIALILQSIILAQTNYIIYNNFQGEYSGLQQAKHLRTPCTMWYKFFFGALWGAFYYEYSKKKKNNIFTIFEKYPIVSYITMALGLVLTIDYRGNYIYNWRTFPLLAYPIFGSLVYALSIAMMFMPLIANRPYFLKRIMNIRFFQITGKTSFLVYLLHGMVFRSVLMNTAELRRYSYLEFTGYVVLVIVISQILAFWAHLCIEKPINNIEIYLTKKKKPIAVRPLEMQFMELKKEDASFQVINKENM